jgi:hypothetical protein
VSDIGILKEKLISYIQDQLGRTPKAQQYSSDKSIWTRQAGYKNDKKLTFDILTLQNVPQKGMTTYATLGLSEYLLRDDSNNQKPRRVELLSALMDDTDFEKVTGDIENKENFYEDSLLYICCYMINEGSYIFPGDKWINFFSNKYEDFSEMEHLFFMTPTLLTNKLLPTIIEDKEIEWLLCVPISNKELKYLENYGPGALEKLLLKNKVDVSDLLRKSVV